jgi:glutamine cyclotransferase
MKLYSFVATLVLSVSVRAAPLDGYRIVHVYPHDAQAFTQGLIFYEGYLYESTGLYGHSSLRRVELVTGKVVQQRNLQKQFFAEGITLWQDKIVQLTWRSQLGFVYARDNFNPLDDFTYATEGWGITQDGKKLIMSDGSDKLYFLNPATFQRIGLVQIRDEDKPVTQLNELEYVNGEVLANIWHSERIARIDPQNGIVLGWIDLSGLRAESLKYGNQPAPDVLNGIAYDTQNNRLFVTGKWWTALFEIELIKH